MKRRAGTYPRLLRPAFQAIQHGWIGIYRPAVNGSILSLFVAATPSRPWLMALIPVPSALQASARSIRFAPVLPLARQPF